MRKEEEDVIADKCPCGMGDGTGDACFSDKSSAVFGCDRRTVRKWSPCKDQFFNWFPPAVILAFDSIIDIDGNTFDSEIRPTPALPYRYHYIGLHTQDVFP
jgi:hypothetical protein